MLVTVFDSVGYVAVVGLFHTHMVDKVLLLLTVEMVTVDRVDKVDQDSLRSLSFNPNKKICQKRVIDPLFL